MQAERVTRDVVAFIYKKYVCKGQIDIYIFIIITAHFAREDA